MFNVINMKNFHFRFKVLSTLFTSSSLSSSSSFLFARGLTEMKSIEQNEDPYHQQKQANCLFVVV